MTTKQEVQLVGLAYLKHQFLETTSFLESNFGVICAVDRCKGALGGRAFYQLYINGTASRFNSFGDVIQFLHGYGYCLKEKAKE